jgi:hypothetical protein
MPPTTYLSLSLFLSLLFFFSLSRSLFVYLSLVCARASSDSFKAVGKKYNFCPPTTLSLSLSLSFSLSLSLSLSLSCVAQQYKNAITPPPSLGNGFLRPSLDPCHMGLGRDVKPLIPRLGTV